MFTTVGEMGWFLLLLARFVLVHGVQPWSIPTHVSKKERLMLYALGLRAARRGAILEVGSYLGASASFLAAAGKERRQVVYCVDTWENQGMPEGPRDTFADFQRYTRSFDNIVPLRGYSQQIAREFDYNLSLSLVHRWRSHLSRGAQ